MAELIKVMAAKVDDRVVLWEVHPDHPNGEAWVVGDGTALLVAVTERVNDKLRSGQLIQLQTNSKPVPPVATEETATESSPLPDGYESMTVADVLAALPTWTPEQTAAAKEYESAHKARKTILEALG